MKKKEYAPHGVKEGGKKVKIQSKKPTTYCSKLYNQLKAEQTNNQAGRSFFSSRRRHEKLIDPFNVFRIHCITLHYTTLNSQNVLAFIESVFRFIFTSTVVNLMKPFRSNTDARILILCYLSD